MVLDAGAATLVTRPVSALVSLLEPDDLVVVNDAATLPASFRFDLDGAEVELRLASYEGDTTFRAVVFGAGDHRVPTEERGPAPALTVGDRLSLGPGLSGHVVEVDPEAPRLVTVTFAGSPERVWGSLVTLGRPVQYAYVVDPLSLFHVQTPFASRPWAVEMPSAARPLTWEIVGALAQRGVKLATITHGAGLSSTGDAALDKRLPLRERYDIPEETVKRVERARALGKRIVAIGTSVVRALESGVRRGDGTLSAGEASTELHIDSTTRPILVDAVLTGMHEPGTSHFFLLEAFAPTSALLAACALGTRDGFLLHEFGDAMLVLSDRRRRLPVAA